MITLCWFGSLIKCIQHTRVTGAVLDSPPWISNVLQEQGSFIWCLIWDHPSNKKKAFERGISQDMDTGSRVAEGQFGGERRGFSFCFPLYRVSWMGNQLMPLWHHWAIFYSHNKNKKTPTSWLQSYWLNLAALSDQELKVDGNVEGTGVTQLGGPMGCFPLSNWESSRPIVTVKQRSN